MALSKSTGLSSAPAWRVDRFHTEAEEKQGKMYTRLEWQGLRLSSWDMVSPAGRLNCTGAIGISPRLACRDGHVHAQLKIGSWRWDLDMALDARFNFLDERWRVTLAGHDQERFEIEATAGGRVKINVSHWPLVLGNMLKSSVRNAWQQSSPLFSLESELRWDDAGGMRLDGQWRINNLHFENVEGTVILANVALRGEVRIQVGPIGGQDRIRVQIANAQIISGEALVSDVYFDFSAQPVEFSLQADVNNSGQIRHVTLLFGVPNVFSAQWRFSDFSSQRLPAAQVLTFRIDDLSALNRLYVHDYLAVLGFENTELSGAVRGQWQQRHNHWRSLDMVLENVSGRSPAHRLQVDDLSGQVHWRAKGQTPVSRIRWNAAQVAGLPIQTGGLEFSFMADQWRLNEPARLPVFDGELIVQRLEVSRLFDNTFDIDFSGRLTPVSLLMMSDELGWPPLHGSIAGNIPGMRKQGERIIFDGGLNVAIFDGQVHISTLSMERIFGVAPVMTADIVFDGLNMKKITTAFDFGEITGLVAGSVKSLRVTNWKIDRMDVEIRSKREKGVKQTISQKALDRISALGGVQGAVSRSFLRFFQRFGYRRLGMRCRLRQNVCEIEGIRPFKGGFLLVEGGGLPRVDVVGYQHSIDWQELVERLLDRDYQQPRVR